MNPARARLALLASVIVVALAAGGWVLGQGFRPKPVTAGARLFDQVFAEISAKYVDSLDVGTLYNRAAAGLVLELGDPHSVFLDSLRLARVQASISGLVGSLGLAVDARDGWVNVVAAPPAGTPADQVGLRSGDRIVAIEGRSTKDWTTEEAHRALRGSPGSIVNVTVERLGTLTRAELSMAREAVYVTPVQRALLIGDGVGYVLLKTFSDSAAQQLSGKIDSLYKLGMRALILDLRGNPGGLLAQGTAVADLFLNAGQPIVSLRGRGPEGRRDYVDHHPQTWPDLRLAVLVDRGTASASEIVAGALQDHDRALLIGRRTYGKGSAQSVFSLAHEEAGVKLTTARWYTPAGRNIDFVYDLAPNDPLAINDDSASIPVFKTDSGRKVYGGGGIVPDIIAGDIISQPAARALFASLGRNARQLREALTAEAIRLSKRGVSDPNFDVTPAMRDAVYARLTAANSQVSKKTFDAAAEYIDRQLGGETARLAFGRPAESRRLVVRDRVVQEALGKLRSARSMKELLAGLD